MSCSLVACGADFAQQVGEFLGFQRGEHGAQAVGAFRVILARVVVEAGRMGDQGGGHVSPSAPGLRHGGG